MKKIVVLAIAAIALLFSNDSEAQLDKLKRAGRTLGNKVIDKTVEKGAEQGSDVISDRIVEALMEKIMKGESIEGDTSLQSMEGKEKTSSESLGKLAEMMGGSSESVDKQYQFDYEIVQKVTGEEGSNTMIQLLPASGHYQAFEFSSIKVITDFESNESYTIINDRLSSMNMDKHMEDTPMDIDYDDGSTTYTVTDIYENIAGYRSRLVTSENKEGSSKLWMTSAFVKNPYFTSEAAASLKPEHKVLMGFPMKVEYEGADGQNTSMEVIAVEKKSQLFDLSKY